MPRTVGWFLASAVLLAGMGVWLANLGRIGSAGGSAESSSQAAPLLVYCAASNRHVVDQIVADYRRETGRAVEIQYGASQTLLANAEVSGRGDLYLPADDSYLELATEAGLVAETLPLATMRAVLVVPSGNPRQITSLSDIAKHNLRLVQANPAAAAIGSLCRSHLLGTGTWGELERSTKAFVSTVTEVANAVSVDSADVGIVFDVIVPQFPQLQELRVPELDGVIAKVGVGVMRSARRPADALHLARYLAARDRGLQTYAAAHFEVAAGDPWAERPKLTLFAGSMLRPAIEATVTAFEQREGVSVTRVYNGCGILVAQMNAGTMPDAYFACDNEFMSQVRDRFDDPTEVSQNELVILVPKGNPKGIRTLRDLGAGQLRVGIGHEKQCAMGWLTQKTFAEGKLADVVMPNVTVQTPTGDMLVNQLKAGSLDAAVAYISNAAGSGDDLDAIRITGLSCSVATQPFAVARGTQYRQLMGRLYDQLRNADSAALFESQGFTWKLASPVATDP